MDKILGHNVSATKRTGTLYIVQASLHVHFTFLNMQSLLLYLLQHTGIETCTYIYMYNLLKGLSRVIRYGMNG